MSSELAKTVQMAFYVISPIVTLLAVLVAYIALVKQSRPQILIQYRPNPDIQTLIDLVIENIGNGIARDVTFSVPLPARCYGIESADGPGSDILAKGVPAIAAGQKLIFDGGQYGGLANRIGEKLELQVSYHYKNPIGINRRKTDPCLLSVAHLQYMSTRTSAEQAIVDALKGPNKTTLQRIERELKNINSSLLKFHDASQELVE